MKLDIVCFHGSPLSVTEKSIYGDGVQLGVGGAELYLLTMCRAWCEKGYDVTLYNNPREKGVSCFPQKNLDEFNPQEDRDILIVFRAENPATISAKGKKIFWSCDQWTVGNFGELAKRVEKVVTISPFHAQFFETTYGIKDSVVIDIPVREWDYAEQIVQKNPLQVLFCSVPDRGITELSRIWNLVNEQVPEAQLHITSDYRLWDASLGAGICLPHRVKFAGFNNVTYHALVPRYELVKLQLESAIQLYDCTYQELFCIATAECEYSGCFPITSSIGALSTTNMGKIILGDPSDSVTIKNFADSAIELLTNPTQLNLLLEHTQQKARKRFGIQKALDSWDKVFKE